MEPWRIVSNISLLRLIPFNARAQDSETPFCQIHCRERSNDSGMCGFLYLTLQIFDTDILTFSAMEPVNQAALDSSGNLKPAEDIEFYYSESDTRPMVCQTTPLPELRGPQGMLFSFVCWRIRVLIQVPSRSSPWTWGQDGCPCGCWKTEFGRWISHCCKHP